MGEAETQNYYIQPTGFTDPATYASFFDALPTDLDGLVRVIQGLVIYDVVASDFYGIEVADERANEIHIRRVAEFIERLLAIDNRPLTAGRPPRYRLVGRCHHFMLLLTAILRHQGVPARARCGFADYFNPGYFEDHWVCEYWDGTRGRWVLVDAQLDEIWRIKLGVDFDILDVPRDRFLVAGEAWLLCRAGSADASKFGIEHAGLRGLWFVAGNLLRDIAALNKDEMLPWDVWGAQPRPHQAVDKEQLDLFDRLAELSRSPDTCFSELRETYRRDDRIRVPDMVVNMLVGRSQTVR
jgi:hypothetical protein